MPHPVVPLPGLEQAMRTMPFDQFGRYHMLREAVDACRTALGRVQLRILDVGGFHLNHDGQPTLPIKNFLPHDDVSVLDTVECDISGYIRGDGTELTFDDASFDLVVTADTLEHIPQPHRAAFWNELLRVAHHGVILLAPFGNFHVEAAETVLFSFIQTYLNNEQAQLKEHREYGLPRLEEWLSFLANKQIVAKAYPTGYLNAWLGMMVIKHALMKIAPGPSAQYLIDFYYNQSFFPTERRNPAYRHLIVAEKTDGIVAAVDAALSPTIWPEQDNSLQWSNALLPTLMTVWQHQFSELVHLHREQSEHYNQNAVAYHSYVESYQQQISLLERVIADQQQMINQHNQLERVVAEQFKVIEHLQQTYIATQRVIQAEHSIRDLTQRSEWLEAQNTNLRNHLASVQNGRIMRLLRFFSRGK